MSQPKKLADIDRIYIHERSAKLNIIILLGTFFNYPRNYLSLKYKIDLNKDNC